MKALSKLGTMAILGAVLGTSAVNASVGNVASYGDRPRVSRRRFRKIRGSGKMAHATKKGPGRRGMPLFERNAVTGALTRVGKKRLQAAHGPDSINARSDFYRLLDRNELKKAREFLKAMKACGLYPRDVGLMDIALQQAGG